MVRVLLKGEGADSRQDWRNAAMANLSDTDALQRPRPKWIDWAWLAFAAVVVVAMVIGYLRAGRAFWRLACEHSSSPSSQRA